MTLNILLTPNFSADELTITSNPELQDMNRTLTAEQVGKLLALAMHCENIRSICGGMPVRIHSGYRCETLNGKTSGSSSTSQHPKCEAVDFDIPAQIIDVSFNILWEAAKAGKFKFGQLIVEEAERDYMVVKWIHCSVVGSLDPSKVGQVMRMTMENGQPKYTLLDIVNESS